MCNVEGDIEDISNCSKKLNKIHLGSLNKCKKCPEKPVLLLQKKDPFCKNCFLEYCDHKFRSTIGKTKKVKHGEKVLLSYSGGRKSAALLHMTQQALNSASVKQISFIPGILFIDETVLSPSPPEKKELLQVSEVLKNTGYPILYSRLELVHRINSNQTFYWSLGNSILSVDFPDCKASQNWVEESMKDISLSAKLDFVKHIRLLLMTEIASKAGYDYLFTGDTATSLAGDLLTDISLGRGSQISSDTNFFDSRYRVPICRPIREFLDKEIALYNHLHNCPSVVLPNLITKTDSQSSVQRLTESFITNLQDDFPATVFTIFRTGGKLSIENTAFESGACILCQSKLDNVQPDACSALEALKISEKLSRSLTLYNLQSDTEAVCNKVGDAVTSEDREFLKYLCHGCSVPFRSKNVPTDSFSSFLHETYVTRIDRHKMKEQINKFLINEETEYS